MIYYYSHFRILFAHNRLWQCLSSLPYPRKKCCITITSNFSWNLLGGTIVPTETEKNGTMCNLWMRMIGIWIWFTIRIANNTQCLHHRQILLYFFFFSKFLLDITVVLKETKKNAHTLKVLLLLKVLWFFSSESLVLLTKKSFSHKKNEYARFWEARVNSKVLEYLRLTQCLSKEIIDKGPVTGERFDTLPHL